MMLPFVYLLTLKIKFFIARYDSFYKNPCSKMDLGEEQKVQVKKNCARIFSVNVITPVNVVTPENFTLTAIVFL